MSASPDPTARSSSPSEYQLSISFFFLLRPGLASDSFWQFAPYGQKVPYADIIDVNSIFYNDTEYVALVRVHAAEMLAKAPVADQ